MPALKLLSRIARTPTESYGEILTSRVMGGYHKGMTAGGSIESWKPKGGWFIQSLYLAQIDGLRILVSVSAAFSVSYSSRSSSKI